MSQQVLEERVGQLEREQTRQGEQLGQVRAEVSKIGAGVEKLLDREARRPDALTGKTIVATLISTGVAVSMLAGFVWWMIANAPAVESLDRRLTKLDDPELGRVRRLEVRVDTLEGWKTTTKR